MTFRRFGVCLAMGLAFATGCSKSPEPKEPPKQKTEAPPAEKKEEAAATKIAVPAPPKIEKGPEVTAPALDESKPEELARQLLAAVRDDKPEVLWFALPASYQAQIRKATTDFADKVDPDVWHMACHLLRRFSEAGVAQSDKLKKHWVLDNFPVSREVLVAGMDGAFQSGVLLANSELCDVHELKQIDIPRFLAKTGSGVMKQASKAGAVVPGFAEFSKLDWLRKLQVVKGTGSGDQAVVVFEAPGEAPFEEPFVKVEGKWLPKRLVDSWPQVMKRIDDAFAMLDFGKDIREQALREQKSPPAEAKEDSGKPHKPEKTAEQKKQALLDVLNQVASMADALGKVKQEKEFNNAMDMSLTVAALVLKRPELAKRKPPAVAAQTPGKDSPKGKTPSTPADKPADKK